LEGVARRITSLSDAQRQELLEPVGELAAAETDPARRAFMEQFPEGFGLVGVAP
jgi:hypothetical protein